MRAIKLLEHIVCSNISLMGVVFRSVNGLKKCLNGHIWSTFFRSTTDLWAGNIDIEEKRHQGHSQMAC